MLIRFDSLNMSFLKANFERCPSTGFDSQPGFLAYSPCPACWLRPYARWSQLLSGLHCCCCPPGPPSRPPSRLWQGLWASCPSNRRCIDDKSCHKARVPEKKEKSLLAALLSFLKKLVLSMCCKKACWPMVLHKRKGWQLQSVRVFWGDGEKRWTFLVNKRSWWHLLGRMFFLWGGGGGVRGGREGDLVKVKLKWKILNERAV